MVVTTLVEELAVTVEVDVLMTARTAVAGAGVMVMVGVTTVFLLTGNF